MTFWYLPGSIDIIFLVVYEPHRGLEGLQGVGFQGKNCFTKMFSNFSEIDFGFRQHEEMSKKYYYNILVSARVNVQLMGESTRLVCVQLKERDFEKKSLTKVMEISNNYYAKISFRGMCKKY